MKADTYREFDKINRRLDGIVLLLAAIATELSEDAEVKALAASLKDHITNLQKTFPAPAGTTPPS